MTNIKTVTNTAFGKTLHYVLDNNLADAIKLRKREEWDSMLEDFLTCPHRSANHLVLGMNKEQREEAMGLEGNSNVKTWI